MRCTCARELRIFASASLAGEPSARKTAYVIEGARETPAMQ
jgi:hypothetical protein